MANIFIRVTFYLGTENVQWRNFVAATNCVKNHVSYDINRFIYLILMKRVFKVLLRTSRNGFIYSSIAYRFATTPKFEYLKRNY